MEVLEVRTMQVFISRALRKVLKEAPKKLTQLRQACMSALEELKKDGPETLCGPDASLESLSSLLRVGDVSEGNDVCLGHSHTVLAGPRMDDDDLLLVGGHTTHDHTDDARCHAAETTSPICPERLVPNNDADRYFAPLRLACESKVPRITEVALACIQKLIAYGYVSNKVVQVGKMRRLMIDVVLETVCSCKDQEDELVQLQIVKAVLTAVTCTLSAVHETTLLLAVKTCFYIYLVSRTPVIQTTANATLTQMLHVVFQRLEFGESTTNSSLSVMQRDAFLVFRSLCKLSMKPLPDPLPSDDSIELRSKLLSLQLLNSIIQNSGAKFRSGDKFVWAVRQYLCVSLLKNGVSPIASVLQLSLDLFVVVIRFFKDHLKSEIGVFFSNILMRLLESSNSSGAQKQLTVQCLRTLVREPQLTVDLFLNYDCDLEATNILASMCDGLSRLTTSFNVMTDSSEQDSALKALALETLVAITDSMVTWEREARHDSAPSTARKSAAESTSADVGTCSGMSETATVGNPCAAGSGALDGSSVPTLAASSVVIGTDAGAVDFEAVFHRKAELQEGVVKFNMKPKKGLRYLTEVCGLEHSPAAVSKFLLETSGLDKRAVGEFLGEGDEFNKQVLYAYVDSLDFANTSFDAALRKFLSYFWLPGEAQKIDRMMEKFAERYCSQNDDDVFANADTAYVLAYSLIMLNTDAHSSQIKKKMTQQEFVNMNRGINDQKDLPTVFLEKLYQAITTNEIKIKEHELVPARNVDRDSSMSRPSRSKLFHIESAAMVKESQEAFKLKAKRKSTYFSSRNVGHVRPMFESTWCALLAACSAVMEESDARFPVITTSLRGFANAIHIAAEFGMHTERHAFVTMLAKYTYLDSTKAMGRRNIESFKTLVQVALADGNGLGASWAQVLKCLSEFQRLHMIGTGAKTDAQLFFPTTDSISSWAPVAAKAGSVITAPVSSSTQTVIIQPTRPRQSATVAGSREAVDLAAVDELNSATMVDKVDLVAIDRIFSTSASLNPEAIVHFVTTLCAVSREELASPTDPQVYSLQKLVEIAYYNMSRVRFVWARIWEVLGEFFTQVGQHPNLSIAMYAVDSLRQLSNKFLEKVELVNFAFQRDFLKPFVELMGTTASLEIKELILGCLDHIIRSRAKSIRSGWHPIFGVFALAASDAQPSIVESALVLVQQVVSQHSRELLDHQVECVSCLVAFLEQARQGQTAHTAASCIVHYATQLHGAQVDATHCSEPVDLAAAPAEALHGVSEDRCSHGSADILPSFMEHASLERTYWPMLESLCGKVRDRCADVRAAALPAFFAIVNHGLKEKVLSGQAGRQVYSKFVLPIFSLVPREGNGTTEFQAWEDEWLKSTAIDALVAAERCFCNAYAHLGEELLDELVALLVCCLQQKHTPELAHAAAEALLHLVRETGASFSQEAWASVCTELRSCFEGTHSPESAPLVTAQASDKRAERLVAEVSQRVEREAPPGCGPCDLQVLLLSTVFQLLLLNHTLMKLCDIEGLLNCLHAIYDKSHRMVVDAVRGVSVKQSDLEEAITLQLEAMSHYLNILFQFFSKAPPDGKVPCNDQPPPLGSPEHVLLIGVAAEYRLVSFCLHVLREYLTMYEATSSNDERTRALAQRLLTQLTPSLMLVLQQLLVLHEPHFIRHLPCFYPLFVDLMHCDSKDIRRILREIFSQRIGTVLHDRQQAI